MTMMSTEKLLAKIKPMETEIHRALSLLRNELECRSVTIQKERSEYYGRKAFIDTIEIWQSKIIIFVKIPRLNRPGYLDVRPEGYESHELRGVFLK